MQLSQESPRTLFKGDVNPEKGMPETGTDSDVGNGSHRTIICRSCGNRITSASAAILVNNSHTHTFFNPHGYVFELGCFSTAPGAIPLGEASSEFTWFSGYAWRISVCGHCNDHIGWEYSGSSVSTFHGLILSRIREVEDGGDT